MHGPPPRPEPEALPEGGRRWVVWASLAAIVVYGRTVAFGWVYDDQMEVVRNTFVTSLANLPRIFTNTAWAGSGAETFLYRPLALASYAVNHAISGSAPWSYHLVNVLLHAVAAALVVALARRWGLSAMAAGVAGLLFALLPVHVEAVVPVYGRKDLLATLFLLGLVLTHRTALARGGWRLVAAPLLYLAAMLSKEVGVVGLALVVAQDLWLERDRSAFLGTPRVPLLYACHMGAAALYLLVRGQVVGGLGIPDTSFFDNPLVSAAVGTRLLTALVVLGQGALIQFLPLAQSPDYSYDAIPLVTSMADPRLLATLAASAALVLALAQPRVRRSFLPLAVAWYLFSVLPVSNLVLVSGTIFAERLLYLPSVATCIALGAAVGGLHRRVGGAGWGVAAVLLFGYAGQAVRYSGAWTDDVALFTWATEAAPRSTKAHHKLGEELLRAGDQGGALRALHRALEIAPENTFAAQTLYAAREQVFARYGGAPDGTSALPADPEVLYALGSATLQRGDTATAVAVLERAVQEKPDLARGWMTLATLRLAQGRFEEGAVALRRFLTYAGDRYPREQEQARAALARLGGP